jgi:ATP-dependent helicase HrpB
MRTPLPIDDILEPLIAALKPRDGGFARAVLQAPPGAGKTTRVPIALLESGLVTGKILMLEPRRLAARAAAERLASELGGTNEQVGGRVGYAMRGDRKSGPDTRIEVFTEGILTRMIQSDPELTGIGAVIFDEFHERSLNADLGLALCLEVANALRDDLILIVMSATLDAAPVAALMNDAPILTSEGRSFPVEPHYLPRPLSKERRFEAAMADLIDTALTETPGGVLAFLPGEGEIRRCASLLAPRLAPHIKLHTLYGAMPFKDQRAAIQPETKGTRKLVLATAIAETSLTIADIRTVVDGGRARRARFDPGTGMARLVTERVSKAESQQRAGRAGRVAPGHAYMLWAKGEAGTLPAFAPAEIETADLTGLALELAQWGAAAGDLPLLTQPSEVGLNEAHALLKSLGALDENHRLTPHGKTLAKMPLHPRLAHMLASAGPQAAELAALLSDRDPLGRNAGADLSLRIKALRENRLPKDTSARLRKEAARLKALAPKSSQTPLGLGAMAALAYPDRVGQRRKGEAPRYVLSGGKGAVFDLGDAMCAEPFVVVTDSDGNPREAQIRQAVSLARSDIMEVFSERIGWTESCTWSKRERRVVARRQLGFGAVVLEDQIWKEAPAEDLARAMLEGVRQLGLTFTPAAERLRTRIDLLRANGAALPDLSEAALLATLEAWLLPFLGKITSAEAFRKLDLLPALKTTLDWTQTDLLDRKAPSHLTTPLGRRVPLDYGLGVPQVEVRLQEMFGTVSHPMVAGQPVRFVLLSPAGKPLQTTTDLPGFWDTSYDDVRKDMRGRYPRHPWPEDPRAADPTMRAKRRPRK